MVANGRSALVTWRLSNSRSDLLDDFGSIPRYSSLCSMWRTTISLSTSVSLDSGAWWQSRSDVLLGFSKHGWSRSCQAVRGRNVVFRISATFLGSEETSEHPECGSPILTLWKCVLPIVPLLRKVRRGQSMQLVWMTIA